MDNKGTWMVRGTPGEEWEKSSLEKKMKTESKVLHTILSHAITLDYILQIDPDLTDLKWQGLSWSMVGYMVTLLKK